MLNVVFKRDLMEGGGFKNLMKDSDAWETKSVRVKLNWFLLLDM